MKPIIIVNFKAYDEGLGDKGLKLMSFLSNYDNVIISVPSPLISLANELYCNDKKCVISDNVFAQHVDSVNSGAHTGMVTVNEVKMAGAKGSLVNHSEKRIPFNDIKIIVEKLKNNNLTSVVCCQDLKEAEKIKELNPDYIAYEPPELIGGDISVSKTKPEIIREIVKKVYPIKVLVGAGIKNKYDITKSLKLGAKGVLVASGVIKAKDNSIIKELIE